MSVLRPQGKFQDYWLSRGIKRDNETIALLTNGHLPVWQLAYPVVTLMSRIQVTDAQVHASCKWPRISFYAITGKRRPRGLIPSRYPSSSLKDLHSSYHCLNPPVPNYQLLPVATRSHLSSSVWLSDERKLHQEVRAKLLGRKPGGLVNILKENPADELESNLCCLSRGFNVLLHFLLGPLSEGGGGGGKSPNCSLWGRK